MIISHGRRYIFVHVPKTGGTALSLALESRAMKDDVLIGDTPKAIRRRGRLKGVEASGRIWKHSGLADIVGLVTPDEINSFFVVTLVRNPWDRMVSYYHWLRAQSFDHVAVTLAKTRDFPEFLQEPQVVTSFRGSDFASYVTDDKGVERCNLFARIEHLHEDLLPFERHLGFTLSPVQRINSSDRDLDYRVYYDQRSADAVGQICATDIARFGYAFE